MEILGLKSTINTLKKIHLEEHNSRWKLVKGISQAEEHRKRNEKNKQGLREMRDIFKSLHTWVMGVPEEGKKKYSKKKNG